MTLYVLRDLDDANPASMYLRLRDKNEYRTFTFCSLRWADRWSAEEVVVLVAQIRDYSSVWNIAAEVAP